MILGEVLIFNGKGEKKEKIEEENVAVELNVLQGGTQYWQTNNVVSLMLLEPDEGTYFLHPDFLFF